MNNHLVKIILASLSVVFGLTARAQQDTAHFRLRYVVNKTAIDSTFIDNSERIRDLRDFLEEIGNDSTVAITGVQFRGTASPEGPYEWNVYLSENRLRTFKELVNNYIYVPDSLIIADTSDIPWDEFRRKVEESDIPYKEEVLEIIDREPVRVPYHRNRTIDARLLQLRKLRGGKVWPLLKNPILRDLRYGDAIFTYNHRGLLLRLPYEAAVLAMPDLATERPTLILNVPEYETWTPRWYLKTNAAAWVLFSANLAVEVDFARHWSATLPIYYCGMDWMKSTIKFRNFTVQPEIRWWPRSSENEGFFLGAHFMMSYYNIALNGEFRYQDYRGRTPALGGGLALGYRMPLGSSKRWHMEFSVGAGVYPLDYSRFYNTPNYKDGQWHSRNKKTYIGLDQVGITFAYSWDMNRYKRTYIKKGGAL